MLSRKFMIAVKLNDKPAYKIAKEAGITQVMLSKLMRGIVEVKPNDERILAVAKVLGLRPAACFKKT